MSSPITESQSNKLLHAIQLVVNDEPGCYSVRDCFPSFVETGGDFDYSEAVDQLKNIAGAGAYVDGIFVVGTTQRAGAIRRKIERVFTEQNIDERPRLLNQEPNHDGTFKSRIYLDNEGDEHTLPDGVETIASILFDHCQVKELVEYLTSQLFLTQIVTKGSTPRIWKGMFASLWTTIRTSKRSVRKRITKSTGEALILLVARKKVTSILLVSQHLCSKLLRLSF
jgi:hypothetical protein